MLIPTRTLITSGRRQQQRCCFEIFGSTIFQRYSTSFRSWNSFSLFSTRSNQIIPTTTNINSATTTAATLRTTHHLLTQRSSKNTDPTIGRSSIRKTSSSLIHSNWNGTGSNNNVIQSSQPQAFYYYYYPQTVRNMSSTTDDATVHATAIQLLKDTPYFYNASDSLLEKLAEKLVLVTAEKGHVFVEEGQVMSQIIIIEEGKLVRTKLSLDTDEIRTTSVKALSQSQTLVANSVTIDYVEGRGRVSGLLHTFKAEGSNAFASVSVATDTAKVWLLNADDFRTIVSTVPQHCLDVLGALARELRDGSKSLRGLMQHIKKSTSNIGEDGKESKSIFKVMCYDTTSWVSEGFQPAITVFNEQQKVEHGADAVEVDMHFTTERLSEESATYAAGYDAVCLFVNDSASEQIIRTLSLLNVKMIAMRCAGFDRVDTRAARAYGMTVARVPAYSPYAVAEMAVTLLMAVNRKIARADARIKMANFSLDSGLMGMDIHGKTVGVMGTGKIGQILCQIMLGFGAKVQCYDVYESKDVINMGCTYVSKDEIFATSDVLFLMMPLLEQTYHTINESTVQQLKKGVLLINTSRGGLVDTKALLKGIRDGIISGVGMDVYEYEQAYFFQDWSAKNIQDEDLLALIGENNVVLTAHQAFFTKEAVTSIVDTTLHNLAEYHYGKRGEKHPNNCLPPSKPT